MPFSVVLLQIARELIESELARDAAFLMSGTAAGQPRPLAASFGDLLSQPSEYGGLGFGTIYTSLMFRAVIIVIIVYMMMSQAPVERGEAH